MFKTLKNNWALFIGFAILATAHGFQGNLLGVRAVIEKFNYLNNLEYSKLPFLDLKFFEI